MCSSDLRPPFFSSSRVSGMNDETRRSESEQETMLSGAEEATVLLTDEQATVLSGSSRSSYRSSNLSSGGRGGAAAPPLEPGQTFGPYRVVKLLGRGGMGVVYEALDTQAGDEPCAVKQLMELDVDDASRRILRQIAHRHSLWTVFRDFVAMAALSLSNAADRSQAEPREAEYRQIASISRGASRRRTQWSTGIGRNSPWRTPSSTTKAKMRLPRRTTWS